MGSLTNAVLVAADGFLYGAIVVWVLGAFTGRPLFSPWVALACGVARLAIVTWTVWQYDRDWARHRDRILESETESRLSYPTSESTERAEGGTDGR